MFSGISSRSGRFKNVPLKEETLNSNQEYLFVCPESEFEITSNERDFSRTAITSPALRVYDGMLTTEPLTVI